MGRGEQAVTWNENVRVGGLGYVVGVRTVVKVRGRDLSTKRRSLQLQAAMTQDEEEERKAKGGTKNVVLSLLDWGSSCLKCLSGLVGLDQR